MDTKSRAGTEGRKQAHSPIVASSTLPKRPLLSREAEEARLEQVALVGVSRSILENVHEHIWLKGLGK